MSRQPTPPPSRIDIGLRDAFGWYLLAAIVIVGVSVTGAVWLFRHMA